MNDPAENINPYVAPRTRVEDRSAPPPTSKAFAIGAWGFFFLSILVAMLALSVTGAFADVFNSFGTELPLITQAYIKGRYCWWLFVLAALLLAAIISNRAKTAQPSRKLTMLFAALIGLFVLTILAGIYAMYLPVFTLSTIK